MQPTTGLVLDGAVSQGAFAAGACSVVSNIPLRRIIGASSGALCAAALAAGVATGRVRLAAEIIEETWHDHAGWLDAVEPSLASALSLEGLSSTEKVRTGVLSALERILSSREKESHSPYPNIEFRCVGTDLGKTTTTAERVFSFRGSDFLTTEGRQRIALCAASSAAFPGLYAPVEVDGRFIADGGICNNGPISYLLDASEVKRVIVVSTIPLEAPPTTAPPRGVSLLTELVELMINERLLRDVRAARRTNERLARLEAVLRDSGCSETVRHDALKALGFRHVEVIEVRPEVALHGTPFSGFRSASIRAAYIATGKERARAVLDAHGVKPHV